MILVIFLQIGRWARDTRLSWYYLGAYVVLLVVSLITAMHPHVNQGICLALREAPLFLLMAFTGTMATLWISKVISHNVVLEYWGRQSLVIYCLHIPIYIFFFKMMVRFNIPFNVLTVLIAFALNLALCTFSALLLNQKYLKWALGRF